MSNKSKNPVSRSKNPVFTVKMFFDRETGFSIEKPIFLLDKPSFSILWLKNRGFQQKNPDFWQKTRFFDKKKNWDYCQKTGVFDEKNPDFFINKPGF